MKTRSADVTTAPKINFRTLANVSAAELMKFKFVIDAKPPG